MVSKENLKGISMMRIKKLQREQDNLMERLVADGKDLKPPKQVSESDKLETESGIAICPYQPKGCVWVGSYRCTPECDIHPQSYSINKEVLKHFEAEPWAIYCLTCGEFLDSRYGHTEYHVIATGIAEYREKIPELVLERIKTHREEIGDE